VSNSPDHAHNVVAFNGGTSNANGAGITTGNSNYGNTSNANGFGITTGGANAGNGTGGASDGNTTSNQAAHSHSVSASDTLSNLQPYIVVNYIIKT
jgi:N-acetylglutamate synthase/N-acetylornithine aminotransferase